MIVKIEERELDRLLRIEATVRAFADSVGWSTACLVSVPPLDQATRAQKVGPLFVKRPLQPAMAFARPKGGHSQARRTEEAIAALMAGKTIKQAAHDCGLG